MNYYIQSRDGKIYKSKCITGKWNEVWRKMTPGDKLYNPYTKRTVIGWNLYKQQMAAGQKKYYRQKITALVYDYIYEGALLFRNA